jgi:hypothetical protein
MYVLQKCVGLEFCWILENYSESQNLNLKNNIKIITIYFMFIK